MRQTNKAAMRAAVLIHEQFFQQAPIQRAVYLPEYAWNNIQQLRQQIDLARQRGWQSGRQAAQPRPGHCVDDCRSRTGNRPPQPGGRQPAALPPLLGQRHLPGPRGPPPRVRRTSKSTWKSTRFRVTTDEIVLEDVYLGAFPDSAGLARVGRAASPIASWPSIRTRPPRTRTSPIPTSRTSSFARAKAARRSQPPWPSAGSTTSFCWSPRCSTPTAGAVPMWSWTDWDGVPCDDLRRIRGARTIATTASAASARFAASARPPARAAGVLLLRLPGQCAACGCDFARPAWKTCPVCQQAVLRRLPEDGLCRSCHEKQRNEETKMIRRETSQPKPLCRAEPDRMRGNRQALRFEPHRLGETLLSARPGRHRGRRFWHLRGRRPAATSRTSSLCGRCARAVSVVL